MTETCVLYDVKERQELEVLRARLTGCQTLCIHGIRGYVTLT